MLLIETLLPAAFRAPHHGQRSSFNMRQHMRSNRPVIISKLLLRQLDLVIQNLLRMRQPHRRTRCRSVLAKPSSWPSQPSPQRQPAQRAKHVSAPRGSRRNARFLPSNLLRRLVFAKTFECCLTHQIICGPGRKIHLRHQLRLHPDGFPSRLRRRFSNGFSVCTQLVQLITQHAVSLLRKTRPGASCIDQFLAVVVAQQQRTHSMAPIRR